MFGNQMEHGQEVSDLDTDLAAERESEPRKNSADPVRAFVVPDNWRAVRLVLVRPPGWIHASAITDVMDSLAYGFRALGIAADTRENEVDPSAVNIFFMTDALAESDAARLPPNSIIYNFEQVEGTIAPLRSAFRKAIARHRVWDYSLRNMKRLESLIRHNRRQVVPIGYTPTLSRIPRATIQDIDVLFCGAVNERRRDILIGLQQAGLQVQAPFGVYGTERDALIARAKVVLNVHAQSTKVLEMVRISYLLANRKAVVTELDGETEVESDIPEAVAGVPYDRLVAECCSLVADAGERQNLEDRGYAVFQKRDLVLILRNAITEAEQQERLSTELTNAPFARTPELVAPQPSDAVPNSAVEIESNFFVRNDYGAISRCGGINEPGFNPPPFYIITPSYTPYSGGRIALHLLCHFLNRVGYEAYVVTDGDDSPILRTPKLTPAIAEAHRQSARDPIAIYAEVYLDNPLNCRRVIRYLLNRPGERCGNAEIFNTFWDQPERRSEFILHFAEEFQSNVLMSSSLFVPIVDERIFSSVSDCELREGYLVYSHRVPVRDDMIPGWARPFTMIEMSNPKTPHQLSELYRKSRCLITFERTGAQTEALMCGCPVVGIPNNEFNSIPMFSRFANAGVGWGADISQLEWATRTVKIFQRIYKAYAIAFPVELVSRIEEALRFFQSQDA